MSEKKPVHYVNNANFLEALTKYKEDCVIAKENGKEDPNGFIWKWKYQS